jgi:hypothetical protein
MGEFMAKDSLILRARNSRIVGIDLTGPDPRVR